MTNTSLRQLLFGLFCCLAPCLTYADSTTIKTTPTRFEFAMNVSTALTKFSGNNTNNLQTDEPYLFALKFTNKKRTSAARLGMNFSVTDFDDALSNGTRKTTENMWMVTAGYEWRRKLSRHFECYMALDAKYYDLSSVTHTQTFDPLTSQSDESTIRTIKMGAGISPTFGFIWNISPRISLYTEGCINFNMYNSLRDYSSPAGGTTVFEDRIVRNVRPVSPSSLYLLIKI